MQDIQQIFMRIEEAKKKMKDIKKMYNDALNGVQEYQELLDKKKTMEARRKAIIEATKQSLASELTKLEDLKIDLDSDMELLSDTALNMLVKGETVEVKDKNDVQYEPVFTVKFKKLN